MKRFLSIAMALVMALATLTACTGGGQTGSSPAPDGSSGAASGQTTAVSQFPREESLYYFSGMGVVPTSFNPMGSAVQWPAGQMQYLLYEALFMMDMLTGELEPLIADKYEVQEDGSIKITVNAKAHFNDGSALTAEDVKFSYDVASAYELQWSSYWENIEAVEAVDAQTIVIKQKADNTNTPVVLDSLQMVPIMPKAIWGPIVEEAGDDVSKVRSVDNLQNPVGSGPYKMKSFNDQGIYLERDENYWGVERFGSLPAPKYIIQPIYKSNDLVATDFLNNKLDMAQAYIPKIWEMTEKNPAIKTYLSEAP